MTQTPKEKLTPREILENNWGIFKPQKEQIDQALTLLNQYYEQKVLEALPKKISILRSNLSQEIYNTILSDITELIKKVFREGA